MLEHGGGLLRAAGQYGRSPQQWLDLSTGINPIPWLATVPGAASWQRLPEEEDGLIETARAYYQAPNLLAVAGSQAAIQALPRLRPASRVGILTPSYNEHAYRWGQAGHNVVSLAAGACEAAVDCLDVLVLCQPNNPTGECFPTDSLLDYHSRLSARGGWLVIDEAFIDPSPNDSLARYTDREGLIVLRSLGKFFGLAGARVGFVLAAQRLLKILDDWLGPWCVAGPSRAIARGALADVGWQAATRQRLRSDRARLVELLDRNELPPRGGCDLFQWVTTRQAEWIQAALAGEGILVRRFESPAALRFGLPATASDWHRLEHVLRELDNPETRP